MRSKRASVARMIARMDGLHRTIRSFQAVTQENPEAPGAMLDLIEVGLMAAMELLRREVRREGVTSGNPKNPVTGNRKRTGKRVRRRTRSPRRRPGKGA